MNSRESSIRTRQLGPNRWNQSPRAWACVSCVSEDVLPASDPPLSVFVGNGNAVEKRPHHRDFLQLEPTSGGTDRYQVALELWPKFCGTPSAVPTIIRIFKKRVLRYVPELVKLGG